MVRPSWCSPVVVEHMSVALCIDSGGVRYSCSPMCMFTYGRVGENFAHNGSGAFGGC